MVTAPALYLRSCLHWFIEEIWASTTHLQHITISKPNDTPDREKEQVWSGSSNLHWSLHAAQGHANFITVFIALSSEQKFLLLFHRQYPIQDQKVHYYVHKMCFLDSPIITSISFDPSKAIFPSCIREHPETSHISWLPYIPHRAASYSHVPACLLTSLTITTHIQQNPWQGVWLS